MTVVADVLVHTWDLATAVGIPPDLDRDEVARQATASTAVPAEIDTAMRASGHFGPRVEVAPTAGALERMLALFGRSPDRSGADGARP